MLIRIRPRRIGKLTCHHPRDRVPANRYPGAAQKRKRKPGIHQRRQSAVVGAKLGCGTEPRNRRKKPQTSTSAPNAATKTRSDTDTGKCPFLCGQENRHAHQPARRIVRHTASMPACRHAGIPAGTRTGRPGNRHAGNGTHRLTGMETARRAQGPASLPPSGHASSDAGTPAGKTN